MIRRSISPIIFACAWVVGCGDVAAPPSPSVEIESVKLLACPDPDIGRTCEFDHVKSPEYLADALKGDYQAQRNISYAHTSGVSWIVARPVQGCGWRMVIMVSRPAGATYDDAGMYRIQCGDLSPADLEQSKRLAQIIYRQIHGADLPALPPIPA
ncbi:hypothetical protein JIP62_10610 [Brevundimonas vitis]|uniref:Lipoprotein n=1 Tax=Brevundimonas vitisensis TaxID=2800818 RepID=A0ABX7BJQ0_9CAUL|nr:hypothetical protein [Brevundimonas vitisensis]QQQ17784.1 hypothetical protein JIP62_10610 [Brevundimonas vitisensis]